MKKEYKDKSRKRKEEPFDGIQEVSHGLSKVNCDLQEFGFSPEVKGQK